jgi:hypothetical protein
MSRSGSRQPDRSDAVASARYALDSPSAPRCAAYLPAGGSIAAHENAPYRSIPQRSAAIPRAFETRPDRG